MVNGNDDVMDHSPSPPPKNEDDTKDEWVPHAPAQKRAKEVDTVRIPRKDFDQPR